MKNGPQGSSGGGGDVLQGAVERITFRAEETGFSVLSMTPEAGFGPGAETEASPPSAGQLFATLSGRVAAVGTAPEVVAGDRLRLSGRWEVHPQHGRRFAFEACEALPPLGPEGLQRYLASSRFPGVGPTLAERIVEALGPNTLAKIREDASSLEGIRGLRPPVAAELARLVHAELERHELLAFLLDVGIAPSQADAVTRALGAGATETEVRQDPYILARRVHGIGFQTADGVARRLGFAEDAPERRGAALLHALSRASSDGHSCLPASHLFEITRELLREDTPDEGLVEELQRLERAEELVLDPTHGPQVGDPLVYLPALYACETRLAANLLALAEIGEVPPLATAADLEGAAQRAGVQLHPDQERAVLGLLSHPVSVLTGGPGVGTTTIVRLVVELAERAGRKVALASPTGRAAKRLAEASGREAQTVHRLLGFEPGRGGFQHDARNPLGADLIVVDEISMLDVTLAHHLAKAVQPPTRLVLVGDPDQLPSVAAGNVLADLLQSQRFPVFRLTRVFRQDSQSLIVENAHRILRGELPQFPERGADGDFFFFPAEDEHATGRRLVEVVCERIPARFGFDWSRDVQVLTPMYRGPCGVDALNDELRRNLGYGGRELRWRGRSWREGDRVIQTRNDYDQGVFNGDMGRVQRISADGKTVTVRFPERLLDYSAAGLSDLRPAFAITVYRAQGAEFPVVVLPLVPQHAILLRRNLFYTAVTRARKLVVLVGVQHALGLAVRSGDSEGRASALCERLRTAAAPR